MHATFSGLMAAWMFVLAVSGWCCHPPSFCAHAEQTVAVDTAECCKHHDSKHHTEDEPAAPCKDRTKCQGACIYLPTEKTEFDCNQVMASIHFLATDLPCEVSQVAVLFLWERTGDRGRLEPPLRLHLLHQVLLI